MSGTAIDQDQLTTATSEPDLSARVIEALSEATGTDPLAMDPLYRVIDTDALDALFQSGTAGVIRFEYEGHEIEAYSDGTVVVDDSEGGA